MSPVLLGQAVGAFISQFLLATILHFAFRRFPNSAGKLIAIHAASAAIGIIVSAYGNADGGPLNFEDAPIRLAASAILFALDWLRTRAR